MPIKTVKKGDLFHDKADALVNAVNCVGSSKAGIAKQFAKNFPMNNKKYEDACKEGKVKLGKMFVTTEGNMFDAWHIINFPTVKHYKDASEIKDIEKGLEDLVKVIKIYKIRSISIPALGCGYGKLKWDEVKPLIESKLEPLKDVEVFLHEPRK